MRPTRIELWTRSRKRALAPELRGLGGSAAGAVGPLRVRRARGALGRARQDGEQSTRVLVRRERAFEQRAVAPHDVSELAEPARASCFCDDRLHMQTLP